MLLLAKLRFVLSVVSSSSMRAHATHMLARAHVSDVRLSIAAGCSVSWQSLKPGRMNGDVPDEQAFAAIKSGIDALPEGAKMMLNSGMSRHIHPRSLSS